MEIGAQTIETERLILRRFMMFDAQSMFNNWASDRFKSPKLVLFDQQSLSVLVKMCRIILP